VELVRILKLAEKRSVRDYAALCLLGYNGLRVSELVGIDIEHLGRDRGFFVVTITRKGGNMQTLALSQETAWAVERCTGDRTSGPLLTSARTPGKRMTRADVQGMVKRYAKWAGITRSIHPHSFRHTFITQSLNAGASAREVQAAAGHADGRMTSYFDHGNANRGREATHTLTAYIAEML
jgi:integrase/recombinase XerD